MPKRKRCRNLRYRNLGGVENGQRQDEGKDESGEAGRGGVEKGSSWEARREIVDRILAADALRAVVRMKKVKRKEESTEERELYKQIEAEKRQARLLGKEEGGEGITAADKERWKRKGLL